MPTDLCHFPLRHLITTLLSTNLNTVVEVTLHNTVSTTSYRLLSPNRTHTSLLPLHPAGTSATIIESSLIRILIRDSILGTSLHYPSSTDTQDLDGPYYKN